MDIVAEINREYIETLAQRGERLDGRALHQYRPITVETGVVGTAEGSARVRLGDTELVVGVKMAVGEPFADTPDKGVLTTNAELVPLASPNFEPGPPSPMAVELARVVDRGIRGSEALDLTSLCITEGEQVWVTFVDIHMINNDGNLLDAAALGAIAALLGTTVPAERFEQGDDFALPVQCKPIACTAGKINGAVMFDPGLEEERVMSTRMTVTTDDHGDIRAMQKGLSGTLTTDEIKEIAKTAGELGKELRKLVSKDG